MSVKMRRLNYVALISRARARTCEKVGKLLPRASEPKELRTDGRARVGAIRTLTLLFNYEPGEFIHGGLARACQSGNSRRIGFPVSSFQFPEIRCPSVRPLAISRYTVRRLFRSAVLRAPARAAICHASLTIDVLTNAVVVTKSSLHPIQTPNSIRVRHLPGRLPPSRQVNDVKLATIIKLQRWPPPLITAGPATTPLLQTLSTRLLLSHWY